MFLAQVVYVPPPPTFWEWVRAVLGDPFRIVPMALYYWPWTAGFILALVLYYDLYLEDRIKGETPKIIRLMKPSPAVAAKPVIVSTPENYAKLKGLVSFFIEEMRACGNPGLEFTIPESVAFDRLRAEAQDYGAEVVAIRFNQGYWHATVNEVNEPGDWEVARWRELIVTPSMEWAILGSHIRKFYSHGRDRESSTLKAAQSQYANGSVSLAVLEVATHGIQALVREHAPHALPKFRTLRDAK